MEKQTFEVAKGHPTISTRLLTARTYDSPASAHSTLQEQQLCHVQSVQELVVHDALARWATDSGTVY
jgi:hypothetical protein